MSSDSSDDENLKQLREAVDSQFINDAMFKNNTKTQQKSTTETLTKQVPSLRPSKEEDKQFNQFQVTPEFRQYVGNQLSKILDKSLIVDSETTCETDRLKRKRRKGGIKLFRTSKAVLNANQKDEEKLEHIAINQNKIDRYKRRNLENADKDSLSKLSVSSADIIAKTEVKHWSNRSKAPIFRYKKAKGGQLLLIEPEFT